MAQHILGIRVDDNEALALDAEALLTGETRHGVALRFVRERLRDRHPAVVAPVANIRRGA